MNIKKRLKNINKNNGFLKSAAICLSEKATTLSY